MKNLIIPLLLCIGLSVNAQLTSVTESGNTGQRLSVSDPAAHGDIGQFALDLSYSNSSSSTFGATGNWSTAMGYQTTASQLYSTAMGLSTTASGYVSTAIGRYSIATGESSTAIGRNTSASGESSTSMGAFTAASGFNSTALGRNTTASGVVSTVMGEFTAASGSRSTAMGYYTTSSDYASTVIGTYNSSGSTATSATSFSTSAPAFVIGNGTDSSNRSDAFKVMFNGDATVSNDLTIEGSLILGGVSYTSFGGGVISGALSTVSEGGNTGFRLFSSDAANHGDIGNNAVDLSYSGGSSSTRGATGLNSVAMGEQTTASGDYSTAMGGGTTASDYVSTVIGTYNSSGSSVTNSATSFNTANTAFVIGNGTDSSNRSDAFKVMFNGDTYVSNSLYLGGTEITSTAAELNVLDGVTATTSELNLLSGLTSLQGGGTLVSVTENGNTGVRLSTSNAANHGDIGRNAVDLSYSPSSSSTRGATGINSVAMGEQTTASGDYSTAMGGITTASGYVSTAMGSGTIASGTRSTAMGQSTTASGYASTTMGRYSIASGESSTSMGFLTTASDYASLVVGQYNSSGSTATSATSFSSAAPAFVIGNGEDSDNKSDAFKVLFNGDTTVSNDLTVSGDVVISSDARLKANIISLGATLSKLLLIDGKSYTMKKNGKQKIGVLAQDIQKVFPELVSTDDNDMLTVNYQGLVPVLINALKEQDKKFKEQEDKMKAQQEEIDKLKEQDKKFKEQEKRLDRLEKLIAQ